MAPKRRISRLAALVDSTPETLTEAMEDVLRETVDELQTYKPRACRRIVGDLRRHRKRHSGAWERV